MATITVKFGSGDEHTYQNVPDTVTPDQIEERALKDFPDRKVTNLSRSLDSPSGEGKTLKQQIEDIPGIPKQRETQPEPSLLEKAGAGIEAAGGMLSGMATSAIAMPYGVARDIYERTLGEGKPGVSEAEKYAGEVMEKAPLQPKTELGKEYIGKAGEALANVPAFIPEIAGARPTTPMRIGGEISEAAGKAKTAVTPKITPEVASIAMKAEEKGMKVPLHMLTDNKMVRMAGEFIDNLPISGSTKSKNKVAFNKDIIKQIGGDVNSDALTPKVFDEAMTKSGQTIGNIMGSITVPIDNMSESLVNLEKAQKGSTIETEKVVSGWINSLKELAEKNNGVISGQTLRKFDSELGSKIRNITNPETKSELSDLQEIVRDAAEKQISDPREIAALKDARIKYAKAKVVEPLVAKGDLTGISPLQLRGRVGKDAAGKHRLATGAAGDMGDLVYIAENFMKEKPSSGTAERGFLIGALTDMGGLGKAILGVGVGNIYNRLGPRLASSIINASNRSKGEPMPQMTHPLLQEFKDAAAKDLAEAKQRAHEANMKVLAEAGKARGESMVAQAEQKAAARAAAKAAEAQALMEAGIIRGGQMVISDSNKRAAKEIAKNTEAEIMASAGRERGENMIKESQRKNRQEDLAKRRRELESLKRLAQGK